MKTLYIAGPITGTTDYLDRFQTATNFLESVGYTAVNPTLSSACEGTECWDRPHPRTRYDQRYTPHTWECYMKHTLQLLLKCDGVALLPNFFCSHGATFELLTAQTCGMEVKPVEEWIREA